MLIDSPDQAVGVDFHDQTHPQRHVLTSECRGMQNMLLHEAPAEIWRSSSRSIASMV